MKIVPSFHKEILDRYLTDKGITVSQDVYDLMMDYVLWREPQVIPVKEIRRELPDV